MTDQLPQISVAICTRDRPDDLLLCLESISLLNDVPDQVIVIAGSNESCPTEIQTQFPTLNVLVATCPENNISNSRNMGLQLAEHEIVLFIDDDATARSGWVSEYRNAFAENPQLWIAGGLVFDSRTDPMELEFRHGLISATGKQVAVRENKFATPHRYQTNVKGCNFAVRVHEIQKVGSFDSFFAFSFDEADLVMTIHQHRGQVQFLSNAIVDHAHSPGHYRNSHQLDRDWKTEYASHTMFMLKHSVGLYRLIGWIIIIARVLKLSTRCLIHFIAHPKQGMQRLTSVLQAIHGIRYARKVYYQV